MRIRLAISLGLSATGLSAQILNQDASGGSSVVWGGSSVGIDVPTGLIKINHYHQPLDGNGWLWGADLQGESVNGGASLIAGGELVPKARLSGLFGRSFTLVSDNAEYQALGVQLDALQARIDTLVLKKEALLGLWAGGITACLAGTNEQKAAVKSVQDAITGIRTDVKVAEAIDALRHMLAVDECPELAGWITRIAEKARGVQEIAQLEALALEYLVNEKKMDELSAKQKDGQLNLYLRVGAEGAEFTYDRSDTIPNLDSRFRDTLFTPLFVQGGLSLRWERSFFGLGVGYSEANNFSTLKKLEYSYTVTDTNVTSGTLQTKKSGNAYAGRYGELRLTTISFDYLYAIALGDEKHMMVGPYYRWVVSSDTDLLPSTSTLGLGLNYIDGKAGKFLGGVYIQTDDLTATSEPKLDKTIQFGLVTRFALSSFFPKELN